MYLSLSVEAEREIAKMAAALDALRAAAAASSDGKGFDQRQMTNQMYGRTAELKVTAPSLTLRNAMDAASVPAHEGAS